MRYCKLFLLALIIASCSTESREAAQKKKKFSTELDKLQDFFQIPGLAISVSKGDEVIYQDYKGYADLENNIALDAEHLFPVASLTKVFSGLAVMKLVEEVKLTLDEPIKKYFPDSESLSDSIQIKHILSHTSQGEEIGKKFYYSSRFSLLTKVIEQAAGMSFEQYMTKEIFERYEMSNTYLLQDSAQIQQENLNIAKPYVLDNGVEDGFIDFGFSSSAGIVSDLQDLRKLNSILDNNLFISEASKKQMFKGVNQELPYGYGIFKQEILGIDIVWAYGQYDCYSSLFLKVPEEDLTLILLANNNLMSDPARLIYGDVSDSMFALSFLKNFAFNKMRQESSEFQRMEMLAQALSESFMARFDTVHMNRSKELLDFVFEQYPDVHEYADISLQHNLTFLKDVAFYRDLGEFNHFDKQIQKIGAQLLLEDPFNPYLNIYFGNFFARKGNEKYARMFFEQITKAKNFSPNWYTTEAKNGLKSLEQ